MVCEEFKVLGGNFALLFLSLHGRVSFDWWQLNSLYFSHRTSVLGEGRSLTVSVRSTQAVAVAGCATPAACGVRTSHWLLRVCFLLRCPLHFTPLGSQMPQHYCTEWSLFFAQTALGCICMSYHCLSDFGHPVFFRAVNPFPVCHNQRPVWHLQSYTEHNFIFNLL